MRFKIDLICTGKRRFLPVNYQYYISSWIYKRIGEADQEFAQFLHSEGYGEGNRRFKFFNFGPLNMKPYRPHWERGVFELQGNGVSLEISFFLPEIAQPFIRGLFLNNEVFIGNRINGVLLKAEQVQVLPDPEFKKTMMYQLYSPGCISRPARKEEAYAQYLSPDDPEYIPRLIENVKTKFQAAMNVPAMAGQASEKEIDLTIAIISEQPKSKLVTVKALSDKETKIRGWLFECVVTAPVEVQQFIYDVGLGEKGSLGFGMVEEHGK